MRKFIALVLVLGFLASCGFDMEDAGLKASAEKKMKIGSDVAVHRICFEGKLFVGFYSTGGDGFVQVWENGPDGPRPVECGPEKP